MRKILGALGALFICATAWAQGGIRGDTVLRSGQWIAGGASIRWCTPEATGTPCSPVASIYTDKALTIAKSNPFSADSGGNYDVYAAPGYYKEQITVGATTFTRTVLVPPDVANAAFKELNNVQFCDQHAGATAGVKIAACIAALPAAGGTADARGLEGAQTISSTITVNKQVQLLLGAATFSCSASPCFALSTAQAAVIGLGGFSGPETKITMEANSQAFLVTASQIRIEHLELRAGVTNTTAAIKGTDVSHQFYKDIYIRSDDDNAPRTMFTTGIEWAGATASRLEDIFILNSVAQAIYCYKSASLGCSSIFLDNVSVQQPPSEAESIGIRLVDSSHFAIFGGLVEGNFSKGLSCVRSTISTQMSGLITGTRFEVDTGGPSVNIYLDGCSFVKIDSVHNSGEADKFLHIANISGTAFSNVIQNVDHSVNGSQVDAVVQDTQFIGGRFAAGTFTDNGTRTQIIGSYNGADVTNHFKTSVISPLFLSEAANLADVGLFRVGNAEKWCWEANPAGSDGCVSFSAANLFDFEGNALLTSSSMQASRFAPNTGDFADTGLVSALNDQSLCWEANPTGTDLCFKVNTSNQFDFGANPIVTTGAVNGGSAVFTTDVTARDHLGRRFKASTATALVSGDFVLSAGWGTTATVSAVASNSRDQDFEISIASSGTGQAANPTITFTFKDGTFTNAPALICQRNDILATAGRFAQTTLSATAPVITFVGTPVAAETYKLACSFVGN